MVVGPRIWLVGIEICSGFRGMKSVAEAALSDRFFGAAEHAIPLGMYLPLSSIVKPHRGETF